MSVYLSRLKRLWCSQMHSEIAWPRDGVYQCRKCREVYAVPWSEPITAADETQTPRVVAPEGVTEQKLAA